MAFATPNLVAFAQEELTVTNAVKTPTAATVAKTDYRPAAYAARGTVDATNGLTYTEDGTTPTATLGRAIAGGGEFEVEGYSNVANLKMIRTGGSDAVVNLTYYHK